MARKLPSGGPFDGAQVETVPYGPQRGRPWEVLEFIDRAVDPHRPLLVDLANKASVAAALPRAEIALRVTCLRRDYVATRVKALEQIRDGYAVLLDNAACLDGSRA